MAWPYAARAQSRKTMPRIGVLPSAAGAEEEPVYLNVLIDALVKALGLAIPPSLASTADEVIE
jgi:hypothetical protein